MSVDTREPPTPKTILLVEDDVTILTCVGEALADAGFEVIEAADAEEALGILRLEHDRISMVCTDVQMSGAMNGIDLANEISRQWPWIKVLIVSACSRETLSALPSKSLFLQKPYAADQLVEYALQAITS
jgi:DNA-binding NtrC family response regulator